MRRPREKITRLPLVINATATKQLLLSVHVVAEERVIAVRNQSKEQAKVSAPLPFLTQSPVAPV